MSYTSLEILLYNFFKIFVVDGKYEIEIKATIRYFYKEKMFLFYKLRCNKGLVVSTVTGLILDKVIRYIMFWVCMYAATDLFRFSVYSSNVYIL